jgi:hypothetical protein
VKGWMVRSTLVIYFFFIIFFPAILVLIFQQLYLAFAYDV